MRTFTCLWLFFFALTTGKSETTKTSDVPKERLVIAVHYLQVAEIYAKTGSKPDVPANKAKVEKMEDTLLRTEGNRLLSAFQPGMVPKERRPEVFALYIAAVRRITVARDPNHEELVKWAQSNPNKWASEMRKAEQEGKEALK